MRWLKNWLAKDSADTDLRDELRAHIEIETAEQIANGTEAIEAQRSAQAAFGNQIKTYEDVRETWGWASLDRLALDLRFGIRALLKSPVWTLVIGATLALGIGAGTAIFSILNAVVFQPLPYQEPDRIVGLWPTSHKLGGDRFSVNAALWHYWREHLTLVEQISLTRPVANFNLTGEGVPQRLKGARSTSNVPLTLGVVPQVGRYFTQQEQLADARVVVLSHGFWKRQFGADLSAIGRKIQLNGEPYEVIGVMPANYAYPNATFELWTPLYIPPGEIHHGANYQYQAIGRLRRDATVAQAQAEIQVTAARLAAKFGGSYADGDQWIGGLVERLSDNQTTSIRATLFTLMAAVGCLLLIGCMNLAVLLVARISSRARQTALRIALGASRGRLQRQLLAEVLPLSFAGAFGGAGVAWILLRGLIVWLPPELPGLDSLGLDLPLLTFAMVASLAVVIVASVVPIRMATRTDLNLVLQQSSRSVTAKGSASEPLVMAQIALAVVLLFGGVLFGRSLAGLMNVSPGFSAGNVLTMHLAVTRAKYPTDQQIADYYMRLVDSVKSLPGVLDAGIVNRLPLSGLTQNGNVEFEGHNGGFAADWRVATPGYFHTIGIPIRQGRGFSDMDRANGYPVGLIDESMARKVFGTESPIGKRFRRQIPSSPENWVEVVGVVGHVLHESLEKDPRPQVYWPELQSVQDRGALAVRIAGDPAVYTSRIVDEIHQVNPDQPVYEVRLMQDWVSKSMQSRSLTTTLISLFGMASLGLACLGIYGIVTFTTQQRYREFGVRLALGADARTVLNLVLRQAVRLSVPGAAAGLLLCWPVGRLLQGMLFGISSFDLIAWTVAPALLVTTALLAGLGPAVRASRMDPAKVLRAE